MKLLRGQCQCCPNTPQNQHTTRHHGPQNHPHHISSPKNSRHHRRQRGSEDANKT